MWTARRTVVSGGLVAALSVCAAPARAAGSTSGPPAAISPALSPATVPRAAACAPNVLQLSRAEARRGDDFEVRGQAQSTYCADMGQTAPPWTPPRYVDVLLVRYTGSSLVEQRLGRLAVTPDGRFAGSFRVPRAVAPAAWEVLATSLAQGSETVARGSLTVLPGSAPAAPAAPVVPAEQSREPVALAGALLLFVSAVLLGVVRRRSREAAQ